MATANPPRPSDGSRFEILDAAPAPSRLVVNVVAMDKAGKTRLALTAPGPICLFNFNRGLEGVVEEFAAEKIIAVANYRVPKSERNAQAMAEGFWDQFCADFLFFLDGEHKEVGAFKTGVIDTGTETWEMIRLARMGRLEGAGKARNYGPVNVEYCDLLNRIYDTQKNLIIIHKMKAEYIADVRTGKMEAAGYNDMRSLVQVNVDLWHWDEREALAASRESGEEEEAGFHLKVRNCRQNFQAVGVVLVNEMITFANLGMLVFPESEPEEWE